MQVTLRTFFSCVPLLLLFMNTPGSAAIYEWQFTPPDSVDSSGNAEYRLYIPDSLDTVRALYCYVPGWQGSSLDLVYSQEYTDFVEENNLAMLCFSMQGSYTTDSTEISLWADEALLQALRELAILSGHPEVEYAAMLLHGFSAGGQFSYHLAKWQPQRVIAFVTMKGGRHSTAPVDSAIHVPGYMFIGETDSDYRLTNLTEIFEAGRPSGAPWALAMEPDAGHSTVDLDLVFSYFRAILPLRLPETVPLDTYPQLLEIAEEDGWLGNRETMEIDSYAQYAGDRTTACWFPNETIAQEWRVFVGAEPTGTGRTGDSSTERSAISRCRTRSKESATSIHFHLNTVGRVTLKIHTASGRKIEALTRNYRTTGAKSLRLKTDLSHGAYFYTLSIGEYSTTQRLTMR